MIQNVNIQILNILPPTSLGTTVINMNIGDSFIVTPSILMQSTPSYQQPQGFDIGSIEIIGTNDTYLKVLKPTNMIYPSICSLNIDTILIYKTNLNSNVVNGSISRAKLYGGSFKINALNVGNTHFLYTASSWDGSGQESALTEQIIGKVIVVVNDPTNNPPSSLSDSNTTCVIGSFRIMKMSFFNNGYSDPEGDPILNVKIFGVTLGTLHMNGSLVQNYPLILTPQQINSGSLIFKPLPNATTQQQPKIQFTVSDSGSGQYY